MADTLRKKETGERMTQKKTRILMIVQDPRTRGGIAAVTGGYRGSRLERDFDVTYVESYRDGTKAQKLIKALGAYARFLFLLLARRPDLVHMHSSFGPSFYRSKPFIDLAFLFRIPMINHIHGSEFEKLYTNAPRWKKGLIRRTWRRCTRIVVLTALWKEKLSEVVGEAKIDVIPNYGVLRPAREKRKSRRNLLFTGLLIPAKGVYDLVRAMGTLAERLPDVRLVMAGVGEMDRLRADALEKGLEAQIRFPGWVTGERKEKLFQEADVLVLPSHTEAMPMSVLEAFGFGLPVVATDVGGLPELVEDGVNGLLCQKGDHAALADSLYRLLTDDALYERCSSAARTRIETQFSLDHHLDLLAAAYHRALR